MAGIASPSPAPSAELPRGHHLQRAVSRDGAGALDAARSRPCAGCPLQASTVHGCAHIVGLMGHEPIAAALDAGADVVLAGRATDTAPWRTRAPARLPPGRLARAKTVECGGQCTTDPAAAASTSKSTRSLHRGTLDPQRPARPPRSPRTCSTRSRPVPDARTVCTLDTSQASYTALDERRVRVEGSQFEQARQATIKLEGSAVAGYETVSITGSAIPHTRAIDTWLDAFDAVLHDRVQALLGLDRATTPPAARLRLQRVSLPRPDSSAPRESAYCSRCEPATSRQQL